jgi:hypothetical protein
MVFKFVDLLAVAGVSAHQLFAPAGEGNETQVLVGEVGREIGVVALRQSVQASPWVWNCEPGELRQATHGLFRRVKRISPGDKHSPAEQAGFGLHCDFVTAS